jgi:hypothetical protein
MLILTAHPSPATESNPLKVVAFGKAAGEKKYFVKT